MRTLRWAALIALVLLALPTLWFVVYLMIAFGPLTAMGMIWYLILDWSHG